MTGKNIGDHIIGGLTGEKARIFLENLANNAQDSLVVDTPYPTRLLKINGLGIMVEIIGEERGKEEINIYSLSTNPGDQNLARHVLREKTRIELYQED